MDGGKQVKGKVLFVAILAGLLIACDVLPQPLPQNEPDYIKDLVVYKEGTDGIVVYFVLADRSGRETTSSGRAQLKIYDGKDIGELPLYTESAFVDTSDFRRAKVGIGAFERERIIYSFGRIRYRDFRAEPQEFSGTILLSFGIGSGEPLTAEETIIW